MAQNPYTLLFGKAPAQFITRPVPQEEVWENFTAQNPSQQIYVITGVRGSGKTVFLAEAASAFRAEKDWVVVELNPNRDLLTSLTAKLASENSLAQIFQRAKINLSFFGFGLEVANVTPITDIETALTKMLESLARQGKRVLVEIDEVSNTQYLREFAGSFQIFVRQNLPIFLLMSGLYENVSELQNTKNLTFLYRAPKIALTPLNVGAIATNYQTTFEISRTQALEMAHLTKGYSFAFQLLGYLTWNAGGNYTSVIDDYQHYLEEYVYIKIWSELSHKDQEVVRAIAQSKTGDVGEIRALLQMNSNQFSPYRKRLIQRGIVNGDTRGYLSFTLPLFEKFVLES